MEGEEGRRWREKKEGEGGGRVIKNYYRNSFSSGKLRESIHNVGHLGFCFLESFVPRENKISTCMKKSKNSLYLGGGESKKKIHPPPTKIRKYPFPKRIRKFLIFNLK
jgi:hypothetical protein